MNRLQKKCLIASAGFHAFLMLTLLFGAAFFTSQPVRTDLQMVDIIPSRLIDAPFVNVGTPNAQQTPAVQQRPPTPAVQQPPKPQPAPPEPAKEIEKPKTREPEADDQKDNKRDPDALDNKPVKSKLPQVSTKIVKRRNPTTPTTPPRTNQTPDRDTTSKETAALANALKSIKGGLSTTTQVSTSPGAGGEQYAGYENVIQSIYQARYDQELISAGDVGTQVVEVEVSVTVSSGGDVISSRLVKSSSNAGMNRLVQRVLERVTHIAPFPPGAKDSQRTFNIIFELKPRKVIG